ncbi:MAG: ATP-grasp domain-containing protein [Anaerolineales bacterium]|nr:ATP-grasp domain-containing protein [Anaerolineales bacterium]
MIKRDKIRVETIKINITEADDALTIVLLSTPNTYRSQPFAAAANKLGVKIIWGVDLPQPLADEWNTQLQLDFRDPEDAVRKLINLSKREPIRAVIAIDDAAAIIAAETAAHLGLVHNSPSAALAARDKLVMRERLRDKGIRCPHFSAFPIDSDPTKVATQSKYPCILKPLLLNGSRGVIRVNNIAEFKIAWMRVCDILRKSVGTRILVEDYIPGREVAVEALLGQKGLHTLAIFDKPDPLEGPFFEETIYVTPSRLSNDEQESVQAATQESARALGLQFGPVHAEFRINKDGVWPIEVAGRSIGGLCSRTVRFRSGLSLEELVIRQAIGLPIGSLLLEENSRGVMMIPIPAKGILRKVSGVEDAEALSGIEHVEITAKMNYVIKPLPEGDGYLGFIFALGDNPEEVEARLRLANSLLQFEIEPEIKLEPVH